MPATAVLGSSLSVSWTSRTRAMPPEQGAGKMPSSSPPVQRLMVTPVLGSVFRKSQPGGGHRSIQRLPDGLVGQLARTITGTAYILVQADYTRNLTESDFSNNTTASSPLQLSAPSLAVTAPTAPATGVIGGTIPISWTVTNTSTVDAQVIWNDLIYISPDNTLDGNAHFVGSFPASAILAAGPVIPSTKTSYFRRRLQARNS